MIAAVIDQRIVQPAIARAGIERDIGKTVVLEQIDDDVRLPGFLGVARRRLRFGDVVHFAVLMMVLSCRRGVASLWRALSRSVDRGADALIGSATADIGDRGVDVGVGRPRLFLEQRHAAIIIPVWQ